MTSQGPPPPPTKTSLQSLMSVPENESQSHQTNSAVPPAAIVRKTTTPVVRVKQIIPTINKPPDIPKPTLKIPEIPEITKRKPAPEPVILPQVQTTRPPLTIPILSQPVQKPLPLIDIPFVNRNGYNPPKMPQISQIALQRPQPIPQIPMSPHRAQNTPMPQFINMPPYQNYQPQPQIQPMKSQYNQQSYQPPVYFQSQPQPHRNPLPNPAVTLPKANQHSVPAPEPIYVKDPTSGEEYGIRCVCGEGQTGDLIVACEMCNFWLHGLCVNVARETPHESYYCPFCRGQRIRCKCNNTKNYQDPLIQCTRCKFWVHKECEHLGYGFTPKDFICSHCDRNFVPSLPPLRLLPADIGLDHDIPATGDRNAVLDTLPDGHLKEMLTSDVSTPDLYLCETLPKYFREFATLFFDRAHDFWLSICNAFSILFDVDRSVILSAIDALANKLIYAQNSPPSPPTTGFAHSEGITALLASTPMPRIERQPRSVKLQIGRDGRVRSPTYLDDGAYICDLPGFLMYNEEVRCDNGLPPGCVTVTNKDLVIDVGGDSGGCVASQIRRSFHFNCIAKLNRVAGEVRVGLYASKLTGPLSEEKNRRGPAIMPDGELLLPLDGYIPFELPKVEWKEKRSRPKVQLDRGASANRSEGVSRSSSMTLRSKKKKAKQQEYPPLSLLSGFYDQELSPLPFVIVEEGEERPQKKTRSSKRQHYYDE